jgi:DNA-binding NtrC family response regulator
VNNDNKTTLDRNLPIVNRAKGVIRPAIPNRAPAKSSDGLKPRILVVDDEKPVADSLVFLLKHEGFEASAAYSGEEALQAAAKTPVQMLISDVVMPGMDGVESAKRICKQSPECRVILFSGHENAPELVDRAKLEGYNFELFQKPLHPQELLSKLKITLAR